MNSFSAGTANTKTMEASNGGNLELSGSSWNNAGGTITAQTGSTVELANSVTITGGTLTSVGTGQVYVTANEVANLTGLTNSGTLNVQNMGRSMPAARLLTTVLLRCRPRATPHTSTLRARPY